MFLLILEQIGNMELLFIGLIVLVVFGPRKIPELAKKAGKIMYEFRKVSNEFKETWEKEASLSDEEKDAFSFDENTIAQDPELPSIEEVSGPDEPTPDYSFDDPNISEVTDEETLSALREKANELTDADAPVEPSEPIETSESSTEEVTNDKRNWL